MVSINPTRTTNNLHFEDLDWHRFEQLVYEILYREKEWKYLDPIGLKGSDGGVDILGVDKEGVSWYVQCKNQETISKSNVKEIADKISINYKIEDKSVLLIVIACEVSSNTRNYIKAYSKEKGFKDNDIWTGIRIQTMLYDDYRELLSRYFGIETDNKDNKERTLQSNKMRKEVEKKLLREVEWNHKTRMEIAKNPSLWFKYAKLVIRSIDDIDDPYGENSSYYRLCPYHLTDVGIELLDCPYIDYGFRIAINAGNKQWRKIGDDEDLKEGEFDVRAEHIVLIPYYSIVDILENGDDYSDGYPVLMCNFEFYHTPFLRGYYKNKPTDTDFVKGKAVDNSHYALLLEYADNVYKGTIHQ